MDKHLEWVNTTVVYSMGQNIAIEIHEEETMASKRYKKVVNAHI